MQPYPFSIFATVFIRFGFADVFVCQTINKNPSFITFISRQNMCSSLHAIKQNISRKKCMCGIVCLQSRNGAFLGRSIAADRYASACEILYSCGSVVGLNRRWCEWTLNVCVWMLFFFTELFANCWDYKLFQLGSKRRINTQQRCIRSTCDRQKKN